MEGETMKYDCESSVERFTSRTGSVFWTAFATVSNTVQRRVESCVQPHERIATVTGRGRVDIGEPWPDPTTPVGLSRLLDIAEGLAVTEWKRRFGGAK